MTPTRRTLFMGAAALVAARVLTPDRAYAAQAMAASADWALATADVEGDVAPRALRLVHGRAPAGLAGSLYRNGPAKFRRPGGASQHWFDGDGLIRRWRVEDGQATRAPGSARPTTPARPTPRSTRSAASCGRCGRRARPWPWTPRPLRPRTS